MPTTAQLERLRSLAIASIMMVIVLAAALVLTIFKMERAESAARQCFSAAEAGYWQHTTIQDAFTECERLIERAELD